ncbi:MAG: hypothetical protein ABSA02_28485 [Trebonia sp.]
MDEMDLAREALNVTPWRPEMYEQARARLRGAITEAGPQPQAAPAPAVTPLRGRGFARAGHRRRGTFGTKGKIGIGAGIGAVAAAAALVLAVTPASQPAAPTGSASHAPATAATSPLMTLAARITAGNSSVPGNASLVIAHKNLGPKVVEVVYALFTDSGAMYLGDDKKTLMTEVIKNENQADGFNTKEIAAARYAVTGNLATARKMMADASGPNDYYLSYAARKKIWDKNLPALRALLREKGAKGSALNPQMPNGQALQDLINNTIWNGCTDALQWAAADPQARAGIMRLLASIPHITVVHSTTDRQPTLTITAGPKGFDNFTEVVTVSAATGLQVSLKAWAPGVSTGGETDRDSRVTVADVKAGKF